MYDLSLANGLLQSGVDTGIFTHAVYSLSVGGVTIEPRAFGEARPDTIFDLASLTKPIATATLVLQCVERCELHLGETVGTFLSQDGSVPHLGRIDIQQLATHTSGLPPSPDWPTPVGGASQVEAVPAITPVGHVGRVRRELIAQAATTPLDHEPGARHVYSDTGYILLGDIIERVAGQRLDDLFRVRVADAAGIEDIAFLPPPAWLPRVAPTSMSHAAGVVHDPRARDLQGVGGHAGLFGSAAAVLDYLEIIRQGGSPLLSRGAVARMSANQIDPAVGSQSLGWFCAGNAYLPSGDLLSNRAFGHTGFTGTMALIDPEYCLSLVLLTNRVINDSEDKTRFLNLRRLFTNAVGGAVTRL